MCLHVCVSKTTTERNVQCVRNGKGMFSVAALVRMLGSLRRRHPHPREIDHCVLAAPPPKFTPFPRNSMENLENSFV